MHACCEVLSYREQVLKAAREVLHSLPSADRQAEQPTAGAHASDPLGSSAPVPAPAAADSLAGARDGSAGDAPQPTSPQQHRGDGPHVADVDVEAGPAAADAAAADPATMAAVAEAAELAAVKRKAAAHARKPRPGQPPPTCVMSG